jgi:predicted SAM-dependent methyltransferase
VAAPFNIKNFRRVLLRALPDIDGKVMVQQELPDGTVITYRGDDRGKAIFDSFLLRARTDCSLYYALYDKESVENRRFYNIGAGAFRHSAWTNVEHRSEWYREEQGDDFVEWDLLSLTPIPVESNSAEIVYSSHTIEHITNDAARNMFNEAYRILEKNGVFRVTTPNIDLDYRAYKENDKRYFYFYKDTHSIQQLFLAHFASSARISDSELDRIFAEMKYEEALDYCVAKCSIEEQKRHPGLHINWWNAKKLSIMLKAAKFRNIHLSAYGQSFSPVLRETVLFDSTHPAISLYMEATK